MLYYGKMLIFEAKYDINVCRGEKHSPLHNLFKNNYTMRHTLTNNVISTLGGSLAPRRSKILHRGRY